MEAETSSYNLVYQVESLFNIYIDLEENNRNKKGNSYLKSA